jgi:hypothetical protein
MSDTYHEPLRYSFKEMFIFFYTFFVISFRASNTFEHFLTWQLTSVAIMELAFKSGRFLFGFRLKRLHVILYALLMKILGTRVKPTFY